jgi:hypothetical protein
MKKIGHYTEQLVNKLKAKTEEQPERPEQPEQKTRRVIYIKFVDNTSIELALTNSNSVDLGALSCILLAQHRKGGSPDDILKQLGIEHNFADTHGDSIYRKPSWR